MPLASDPGERHKRMIISGAVPNAGQSIGERSSTARLLRVLGLPSFSFPSPNAVGASSFAPVLRKRRFFGLSRSRRVDVGGRPFQGTAVLRGATLFRAPVRSPSRRPGTSAEGHPERKVRPYGLVTGRWRFTHAALPDSPAHSRETDGNLARHSLSAHKAAPAKAGRHPRRLPR